MKLTYRDKIILAILIAVVVCVGGYMLLIKNKSQEIKDNTAKLEQLEKEKQEIDDKIERIEPLQKRIRETYAKADALTGLFVPKSEIENTLDLDKKLQKYAEDAGVKIIQLELDSSKIEKLDYYYFKKEDTDKEMRTAVDINGDLQDQFDNKYQESVALSQRTAENVLRTKYAVKVRGEKQEVWDYLKAIADIDSAVMIDSVNILDYTFGAEAALKAGAALTDMIAPSEEAAPAEGEEEAEEVVQAAPITTDSGEEITNESDVQIVISLYSIYKMSEPDVESIPAAE